MGFITRFVIATLVIALLGVVLIAQAAAQEPSGTITGHIYQADHPDGFYLALILVVPADTPQPIPVEKVQEKYEYSSDNEGWFTISGLADGDYLVGFWPVNPDSVPYMQERILFRDGDTTRSRPAMGVTIAGGETVVLDVPVANQSRPVLQPLSPPVTAKGASVSGTLVSATGPISNTRIWLIPADADRPIDLDTYGDAPYTTQVGDDGRFKFSSIADGEYLLLVPRNLPEGELAADRIEARLAPEGSAPTPISLEEVQVIVVGSEAFRLAALRISVVDGRDVSGIELKITFPTPALPGGGPGVTFPDTGGPGGGGSGYPLYAIAFAIAAAGLIATLALRLRSRRGL